VVILLATTAASAIIVRAGIAPAFAGAVMVIDNVGRRPLHSATTVAAVSSAAPPPHRPTAPLPSAVALAATATVAALPSSADGRHTTSDVVFTAICCFLIVDC
jgi:hypothetical protein